MRARGSHVRMRIRDCKHESVVQGTVRAVFCGVRVWGQAAEGRDTINRLVDVAY